MQVKSRLLSGTSIGSQINVRYFDTEGSRAVCTGFYKESLLAPVLHTLITELQK